jgi:nucleoside phosphorylase
VATSQASAIILTALSKEYLAVRAHLDNITEDTHKGTVYDAGKFSASGRSWDVAIVEVGRHSENASFEAERAIDHFNPKVGHFYGSSGQPQARGCHYWRCGSGNQSLWL